MKRLFDNVNEETYNSCFLACVIVCFLFSCTILGATYISNRQAAKDMNEMSNMIIAYIATATDDEYDQIAEEIRHDLHTKPSCAMLRLPKRASTADVFTGCQHRQPLFHCTRNAAAQRYHKICFWI